MEEFPEAIFHTRKASLLGGSSLTYVLSFLWTPPTSASLSLQSLLHDIQHAPEQTFAGLTSAQYPSSALCEAYQELTTNDLRQLSVIVSIHFSMLSNHLLLGITPTASVYPSWLPSHLLQATTMNAHVCLSWLPSWCLLFDKINACVHPLSCPAFPYQQPLVSACFGCSVVSYY